MFGKPKEQVLQDFFDLDDDADRVEVLDRIAGDEDGSAVDMYVEANMVMSSDQFREAKQRLIDRGYAVDFVNVA